MQSFTTQPHQRNYQGNVILTNHNRSIKLRSNHYKLWNGIALAIIILTITVTGGLLGSMTLHNHQLKYQLQILEAQTATISTTQSEGNSPHTADSIAITANNDVDNQNITTTQKRGIALDDIPISKRSHATQPLPSVENQSGQLNPRLKD